MKKIKFIVLCFVIIPTFVFSQTSKHQLDSLYNLYMGLRTGSHYAQNQIANTMTIKQGGHIKCGLGLSNQLRLNFSSFSPTQQEELKKILARPVMDTSIVSPSGKFRIHYDTSGANKPGYSISDLAIAYDSSYNFEVTSLGYPEPPTDNNEGGDNLYDVYVLNLGLLYGETDFDQQIGSNRYTTYILMDNDFVGYFTEGIDAARVTAAHEFHHAIQVGNYIFRADDLYFYELTSTAFEDIVYPSINDYIQYLPSYFNNTQVSFAATQGYDFAIWNLYLNTTFGPDIIKRQWELMPANKAINAINTSLTENNSTFASALKDFSKWTYYTNYRNVSGKYFIDAAQFPIAKPVSTLSISSNPDTVNLTSKALSNNFVKFVNSSNSDTIDVIITNTDVQSGADSLGKNFSAQYILFTVAQTGANKLNDNYYSKLNVDNLGIWQLTEFVNGQLVVPTTPTGSSSGDFAYPNPFNYKNAVALYLPVKPAAATSATLNIYSSSLNLLYSGSKNVININGKNYIVWNGRQTNNNKLPSGVYIYITKMGDEILKGKLVIFNE